MMFWRKEGEERETNQLERSKYHVHMCSSSIEGLTVSDSGEEIGPGPENAWMGGKCEKYSKRTKMWACC